MNSLVRATLVLIGLSTKNLHAQSLLEKTLKPVQIEQLLVRPNHEGHSDFIRAIDLAKKSIYLKMFRLTDRAVTEALIRAQKRNVVVKIILDKKSLRIERFNTSFNQLKKAHVLVLASSSMFSISHEKSMIIDENKVFITTINLTNTTAQTRDFGIVTSNADIVTEVVKNFLADWNNASTNQSNTPSLVEKNLVWSPGHSQKKLVDLILSAKKSILSEVENLGDPEIQKALMTASKNVQTRLIVPMCDKNPKPYRNTKYIQAISSSSQVSIRLMPYPPTYETPYPHGKIIIVDHSTVYLGSINFSVNSTQSARELGIILQDTDLAKSFESYIESDWKVAQKPDFPIKVNCPTVD